jgi:hypothetical protein
MGLAGKKERRREGRKEGKKERRKEGKKERRKEGKKERRKSELLPIHSFPSPLSIHVLSFGEKKKKKV